MPRRVSGGRPSKGDRHLIASRPPRAVADAVIARADARGMTITDYVSAVLAQHVGMDDAASFQPVQTPHLDEELPLTG